MNKELIDDINSLVLNEKVVFVSSANAEGYPNTKAMFNLQRDGLTTHYFSTNLSSKRTQQFMVNSKSCIYFCNQAEFKGLMLIGKMEVMTDRKHREMLWAEGNEIYYPDGIDDTDYVVLKFTAESGNYYYGLSNCTFKIDELVTATA